MSTKILSINLTYAPPTRTYCTGLLRTELGKRRQSGRVTSSTPSNPYANLSPHSASDLKSHTFRAFTFWYRRSISLAHGRIVGHDSSACKGSGILEFVTNQNVWEGLCEMSHGPQ
jgi:hypothetical protein